MSLFFGNGVVVGSGSDNPVTGIWIPLGDINENGGDGDFSDGVIELDENMPITIAIDKINEFLVNLVPSASAAFPNGTLVEDSYVIGDNPRLCSGTITDNTNGGTIPVTVDGNDVSLYRGTSATFTSNYLTDNNIENFGPTFFSTVSSYTNNTLTETLTFTAATGDTVDANGLEVVNNDWFPASTPNFNQDFDARVKDATVINGWNRYSLLYDDGEGALTPSNDVYVLKDSLTTVPTISGGSISENVPSFSWSSGIQHYTTGTTLSITGLLVDDLSGFTYSADDPFYVSANGDSLFSVVEPSITYGSAGLATPLPVNTTGQTLSFDITLNATDSHTSDWVKVRAHNVNGYSSHFDFNSNIVLYMDGATIGIDENNISGPSGSTVERVEIAGSGDTPTLALPATPTAWDSMQDLSVPAYSDQAVVTGGTLKHDVTDYSTGYLPVGTNYSGKDAIQYVTFAFTEESLSNITIDITGTYSGMWIGMEGYSDNATYSPNAIGATWWDAFAAYNGSGLPGRTGDTIAGCADGLIPDGTSGIYNITFGSGNTSKEPDGTDSFPAKTVYVRIRLEAGDEITALTIS